jgi:hypothetical protein
MKLLTVPIEAYGVLTFILRIMLHLVDKLMLPVLVIVPTVFQELPVLFVLGVSFVHD